MSDSMQQPDISVCVANYNGGSLVLDCLQSVFAQEGDFRLEVLVHDDASTDGSLSAIRNRFPLVRIIESATNVGFCTSNNRMAAEANGQFLLLLNNDAILRADSLRTLLSFATDHHEDCILGLPQYAMEDGTLIDRGYRTDPFLNPIPILSPGTHEAGVVTGACLWIPRTVWDRVGGFPAWFESVAEDIYLCLAARMLGHRIVVLDGPGFDHWVGRTLGGGKVIEGGLRTTVRRRRLSERNKTFAMLCCYPWRTLCALLPVHALFLALEALFVAVTGPGPMKAWRIYGGLPGELWRRRGEIRDLRRSLMRRRHAEAPTFAFTDWLPYKAAMLLRYGRPRVN